jgi:prepilin signal peptidase PulO-like enzyme (type II secretory pathway)
MDLFSVSLVLGLFGALLGSFAGAQVWRLRASQLRYDEKAGEKVLQKEMREIEKIPKRRLSRDRSVCLHCGHRLQWLDLIPILSWLKLRGKCRYCHKKIGLTEPMLEIGVALFFVLSLLFWPYPLTDALQVIQLVIWLIAGVGLAILFVYDLKWFLLPDRVVFPLILLGAINSGVAISLDGFTVQAIANVLYACLILSGLYFLLYVVSQHRWVGFGDVKLGLALALLLADWRLALLALFSANLLGTLIVIPLMMQKKLKRSSHVPFGPLLIVGWFVTGVFGMKMIDWYWTFTMGIV